MANTPEMDKKNSRVGPSSGDQVLLQRLLAYCHAGGPAAFLSEVVVRTAHLCAAWMTLGFVHGMLNTDNCHVWGITMDVSSSQFLAAFDPTNEAGSPPGARGRYAYRRQPAAFLWNLRRLADTLCHVVHGMSQT